MWPADESECDQLLEQDLLRDCEALVDGESDDGLADKDAEKLCPP